MGAPGRSSGKVRILAGPSRRSLLQNPRNSERAAIRIDQRAAARFGLADAEGRDAIVGP